MKKMWTLFRVTMFAAAVALASCSEEDQSELSLNDLTGTATIEGVVTYNAGYVTAEDGSIKSNTYLAADSVIVEVAIKYSEISNSGSTNFTPDGEIICQTATDSDGKYSITANIEAINEMSADVKVLSFYRNKGVMVNNKVVTIADVEYTETKSSVSIRSNMPAYVCDLNPTGSTSTAIESTMDTRIMMGLKLITPCEDLVKTPLTVGNDNYTKYSVEEGTKAYANATIGVKVSYTPVTIPPTTTPETTLYYEIKSDDNGEAVLDVNVFDSWEYAGITVEYEVVDEKRNDEFTHYYYAVSTATPAPENYETWPYVAPATQTLDGYYIENTGGSVSGTTAAKSNLIANAALGAVEFWENVTMTFIPVSKDVEAIKGVDTIYDADGSAVAYETSNGLDVNDSTWTR